MCMYQCVFINTNTIFAYVLFFQRHGKLFAEHSSTMVCSSVRLDTQQVEQLEKNTDSQAIVQSIALFLFKTLVYV